MPVTLRALTAAIWLAASPVSAAEWVRVETHNFIVYGETGERRLREVAAEFERFREALARVIPGADAPAAVPTAVVVFDSTRSFQPYVPRYKGKPVKLGGYFFSSDDMNVVALADSDRETSLRTIFHEYVHLVIDNSSREMPVWLSEGLAEYYSTFEGDADGRRALIGRPILAHLQLLGQRRLMPMSELLATDRTSAAYNEGARQSLFYAQSWALVHMLVAGTNRAADLSRYARLVSEGVSSLDAWQQVFKADDVVRALERYVTLETMTGFLYRFEREIPAVKGDASKVSEADAHATLADLVRRVAPEEEADARFRKVVAMQPPSARARAIFGLFSIERGRSEEALPMLLEAAADKTDWLVQYHAANGLTRLADASKNPDSSVIAAARDALTRVFAARPELPHAHALAARLDSASDETLPRALEGIRKARAVTPGREDYMLLESYILARRGEFAAARQLAAPLAAPRYSTTIRQSAQHLLEQITTLEMDTANFIAKLEGRKTGAPSPEAPASGTRRSPPTYRMMAAGERRTEGVLERINCSATSAAFLVRVGEAVERFESGRLETIEFISYREDLRGSVTCGARTPPDPVYITWKLQDGNNKPGQVVAVEFLPR
jgi:Tfp pilus assembly protein PilF